MKNIFKPIPNKQILAAGLQEIDRKWGHYCKYNDEVTRELVQAGFIKDLRGIRAIRDIGQRKGFCTKTVLNVDNPAQTMVLLPELHFPIFNQQRLFKKGKLVKIRPKPGVSLPRAKKEKLLEIFNPHHIYVGWDYQGNHYSSREFRVSTLLDCLKAEIVYEDLKEKGIELKVEPYPGRPENRGVNLVVRGVPSLSSNKTYQVTLYHVAAYKSNIKEAISISYDLKETHATSVAPCQKPLWYAVKDSRGRLPFSILDPEDERGADDFFLDYHVGIAFKAAEDFLKKQGYKIFNPFITSEDLGRNSRQYLKNLSCVRKEVIEGSKRKRVPLTSLEEEISLWDLKRYNNYPYLKRKGLI